jgi:Holliday junction resolvase RusA-like endonuclease
MRLIIDEIPVSMNGSNGLLRMGHWRRSRYNERWRQLVRAASDNSHKPCKVRMQVSISQMRKKLLDRDNLFASCKPILDGMVHWKLIKDDNEEWIELDCVQNVGKVPMTVIVIEELQ